ncbi:MULTISPECIES: cupin domain-containing protein [Marinomonas]|mgnify:CR=1 FL=1|jgi:quercetin dioxygenase-like cupin family protein|uniref:cupin domain-containing protein n=1 Tax=Marinomonas TaxID=28253 RepID=UPI001404BEA2|nr:cupin domain-containing protein [Marinomonas sp. KMM3893]
MENERIDAVVNKYQDIPIQKFGEGIDLRRLNMKTVAMTWVEMKEGNASPLHRHEDEQTVAVISGRLRSRSGPQGEEVYCEMGPGDILTVPSNVIHQVEALEDSVFCEAFGPGPNLEKGIQTVYMRKQQKAAEKAKAEK